ncbi:MAG: trypsin-like serine protease [Betaproteobacteria bacterium]|nr:trypsin-like serine protease [Betaproteobacteria bacterium]
MSLNSEIDTLARTTSPYKLIGVIEALWGNNGKRGTFAIVGENDILTAGHLIYDPALGGRATSIKLYLAADFNGSADRFDAQGTAISFTSFNIAYQSEIYSDQDDEQFSYFESSHDLAIIGIDQPIGTLLGTLSVNPLLEQVDASIVTQVGYPSTGSGMMELVVNPQYQSGIWVTSQEDLKPGDSGGPLLVENTILGVASATSSSESIWASINSNFPFILEAIIGNNNLLPTSSPIQFDYSIAANSKSQSLNGFSVNETIRGGFGNDSIYGNSGNDVLYGDEGNDRLEGGDDNDILYGGAGNDILSGGNGSDVMDGGIGADNMTGGSGADIYMIDHTKDRVVEISSSVDVDIIRSYVSFKLPNFVENISLEGTQNINATGNSLNNHLVGNSGKNKISGASGNDKIDGGGGNDTLTGGSGNDIFVLHHENTVTIQDFTSAKDKIQLSANDFTGLDDFHSGQFLLGTQATAPEHHLIYDRKSAVLYYDPDGDGGISPIKVAIIGNKSLVTANDIIVN